jgi:hypothetical protein
MLLGAALVTSLLTGCKQGEGERCQIDDDCNTNFYCQLNGLTREAGGYCRSTTPTTTDMASTGAADLSAAVPPDMVTPAADMAGSD